MTVHDNRKDFACDKCEKKFERRSNWLLHQKTVHGDQKNYTCNNCEKMFRHRNDLTRHQKLVHEETDYKQVATS
ncbi:zinc finger protein 75A-like [Trichogramma pretiosum]|uniref:zinc finger protein 75A-like n=1 Tax=Trichogramma pretiosum TaxID=7493 RepID=UPI0006C9600F|nr:zinc finger protein 75A-like [Trichogramma pretiosum]